MDNIVLVVDDSPESLGMLNVALNQAGYTALVALDGTQALSIAEKVTPEIVLMDAVMPNMDGFETCRQFKKMLPNVPVIFMTGLTDSDDVVRGFNAGGVDYVTKPIAPDEVLARIKAHLSTARLARSAQNALDHAGKNVFSVDKSGEMAWATPQVYELISNSFAQQADIWQHLKTEIDSWLQSGHQQPLVLSNSQPQLTLHYERQEQDHFLLRLSKHKPAPTAELLQAALPITKREAEVLFWLSHAKTNWEISQILSMSPRTVNKHLEMVFKKLAVENRTAAAAAAIKILDAE
ncbi:DNA-binding response regulator [Gayadomonas joobiniege]|uniref:DNA-binding response regulator n=1 Tax=Gayadomonas joobiniege TaxID=1234606 RepID=UPI00036D017D|nr:DNA-binding response regulator [Gayadomonas joobiniege]